MIMDEFDELAERLMPWDHRVDDDMHKAVAAALRKLGREIAELKAEKNNVDRS